MLNRIATLFLAMSLALPALAEEGEQPTTAGVLRFDLGVTQAGTLIPALMTRDDLDLHTPKSRLTLIGSPGDPQASAACVEAIEWFYTSEQAAPYRKRFALSAVPAPMPAAANPTLGPFPPENSYYHSQSQVEAQYLWRWLGMHAPDLVALVTSAEQAGIIAPEFDLPQLQQLPLAARVPRTNDLISQLIASKPCEVGAIPAVRISGSAETLQMQLIAIMNSNFSGPSPARAELQRRLARSPGQVALELTEHYGNQLSSVVYIPAVALIARLRLGELTSDPHQLAAVEKLAAPYLAGDKKSLPENPSGSHFSGHLIFSELARHTGNPGYTPLAQQAANFAFDANGNPLASMPTHSEMSDAVFMGCPILVQTGKLTGEEKYTAMALTHFRFMQKLCLRDDGLYRHSPWDQAAWGRGNGFPALGVALCLSDLPSDSAVHFEMLAAFRKHMAVLALHHDATGMWHQVIDHPGSYREFTSTSMITFAMLRGMQQGWLEQAEYLPHVERAWPAILMRIGPQGSLVDVCTGTGKQRSLRDYLDRPAILGRDDRGGAMALLVATEMEAFRRWQASQAQ